MFPIRIGAAGTWGTRLYPGDYTIFAVRDSIQADLSDPAIAARYQRLGKTVQVADSGTGSIVLDLVTDLKETP